jgi:alpha-ribazole phosphatase/probable phosphoglycerate mutase
MLGTQTQSGFRKVLLIRHAQSQFHGRFCGSSDPPLSHAGEAQAREVANKLRAASLDHICCSPLRRALATAERIAAATVCPLTIMDGLREIDFGSWEGLTWSEIELRDPAHAKLWMEQYPNVPAPGGEPFEAFRLRVLGAFRQIRLEAVCSSRNTIAVVAHGGVLGVLLATLSGQPFRSVPLPQTCAVLEVHIKAGWDDQSSSLRIES